MKRVVPHKFDTGTASHDELLCGDLVEMLANALYRCLIRQGYLTSSHKVVESLHHNSCIYTP